MKTFLDAPRQPLSSVEEEILLDFALAETTSIHTATEFHAKRGISPMCSLIYERLARFKIEVSLGTLIVTSIFSAGHAARAVLWAYTLRQIWLDNGRKRVDLVMLGKHFNEGVPTLEACKELWYAQKTESGDNRLDDPTEWMVAK